MNTFDGCCGSCEHMNTNDYSGSKHICKCTYRQQYYSLTEPKCSYYRYDPRKDYYDLNRRWYIVSAIFEKLGLPDSYDCVAKLQYFRENVLEKDSKYMNILIEYDIIGPKLAELLKNDSDSEKLCQRLIQVFLVRILDLIMDNKNDEALNLYIEMVNLLKTIYEVDLEKDNLSRSK